MMMQSKTLIGYRSSLIIHRVQYAVDIIPETFLNKYHTKIAISYTIDQSQSNCHFRVRKLFMLSLAAFNGLNSWVSARCYILLEYPISILDLEEYINSNERSTVESAERSH